MANKYNRKRKSKKETLDEQLDRSILIGRRESDLGTPELANHAIVTIELTEDDDKRARNRTQTTLDYCFYNDFINEEQYLAGCRFFKDFVIAGMSPSSTAQLDKIPLGKNCTWYESFSDSRLDAKDRLTKILRDLGNNLASFAWDALLLSMSFAELEAKHKMPRRSAKVRIQDILDYIDSGYQKFYRERK